ncbi:MAG: helix-turn-helix transcriptional regulator [Firmicutes bacterium]|nr:helix-turn-helix transcriptional regulator [Bacillota bacterium]
MDFGGKLQELRKSRGMTQEELAEALFVSRTAISKWESGRGYPNIDSLKEISAFFGVTIDELLTGERLLSIAEREKKESMRRLCDQLLGGADLLAVVLMILPLYPKTVEGFVYSVNLFQYVETSEFNRLIYWGLFLGLVVLGIIKLVITQRGAGKGQKTVTCTSMAAGMAAVIFLALAREAYAVTAAFLLLALKAVLWYQRKE